MVTVVTDPLVTVVTGYYWLPCGKTKKIVAVTFDSYGAAIVLLVTV